MQFLVFILTFPFLWIISILPFRIFYWLSDCIYVLVYYIVGYRKKTVRENLALALPHLSDKERLEIEKKSYHHLCDMFLEMVKTMTISSEEMNKRFKITNLEVIKEYEKKGKSIMLIASHYASWEWLITLNQKISFLGVAVYKKLANKHFDKLVRDIRSKYNTELVPTSKTIPLIANNQKNNIQCVYGLASDQSPKADRIFHWESFMGVEVPVHTGPEMLAKKYDMTVVFAKVKKVKRGYYELTIIPLSDNPKSIPDFGITHIYIKEVEKQILEAPEYYFWTHKRWKHRR
ncbi:MAG TPA: lysophospholipid acyltransferase family protein [Flavobacterium sp.]|jgi:KDO2-lipid IV(A) lauroyltransferase|uniref:lysophospholipid acyltransferase family protein n=1 Tax=Flavobacterium sp. TaxID=239 RepID=UPI001B55585E|nr:lysophospholipid acyltransferase family protein [Flavobacterium sp.]MBP6146920.1 lysophospholipid acyltransferase family protein [Flavobacterium sp.]MBP7183380.1 lysophospholipid acyltransferase family protein [Flavobacterium sp.]MBP7318071.1 lysophospholipid acyltransferase family protein [Flavobacterium sp.]MBP8886521.1 lysophospholipid acyltransferase family protein [Flavobacterium sp.]HRL71190.1 lysophospholipid acyltransferase family protein [Flavobacterium sp.]